MQNLERSLERLLFASRWLLAPFYLGLVGAIVVLLWYFGVEFVHLVSILMHGGGSVVVGVLSLVDLVLVANLLIIIIFAGYENFVSKIDTGESTPTTTLPPPCMRMDTRCTNSTPTYPSNTIMAPTRPR